MTINESVAGDNSVAITGTSSGSKSIGVKGIGNGDATGVKGEGDSTGVWGHGKTWMGVYGFSQSTTGGAGVMGEGDPAPSVIGKSTNWIGVYGETNGRDNGPAGVLGEGKDGGDGVKGHASGQGRAGVAGFHLTNNGPGIFGKGSPAGLFEGDIEVTGDIRLQNADCAEDFDIVCIEQVEPGTVMVIDSEGALRPSDQAYDKRVAGVISGAGNYKPGLLLDKQKSSSNRMPISLMGKVYCKVDASYGAIEVGDLLTTSNTLGYAMKADDPLRAFGAVLGKALQSVSEGQELIPILVTLQ
jgi:hypothetical protein